MKIALVMPKSTMLQDPRVWPPLGLFYLSSQLEAQGHQTDFFDLNFDELPQDGEYDQMWVSTTAPQIAEAKRIAEVTKGWKTRRVLGGAGAWANPETHKDIPYDLIVAGEADHPYNIRRILESAQFGGGFLPLVMQKDLEWVRPPNRRWTTRYHSYMTDKSGNSYRMTSMFTVRGCPMSCAFCESGREGIIWDSMVRYEPMDTVEYQIREIKDLGFTGIGYYDDIFIINRKRTQAIMELHRKYGLKFRCFLRSDILSKHGGKAYLQELKDGGLIEIFVGVESADNHIKDNIHKGTTIEQDTDVLNWCRELGIVCKMSFILGLPGESRESMETTRKWILEHKPDKVQVDRLIPFSGTPLTKKPWEYDLNYEERPDDDWFFRGRDMNIHSFVSTSHLTRDEIDEFWHKLEIELHED